MAEHLLGDILVMKKGKNLLTGRIVETEAYPGREDDASHTHKGRKTFRTETVYAAGGTVYVYFIYGKFWCFNIVTGKKDDPQAVFIRALEPLSGIDLMKHRRATDKMSLLTSGPCRWTSAFGVDRTFLGKSLDSTELCVIRGTGKKFAVKRVPRVGVDYAVQGKDKLLRFYINDNPFVSKK